MAQHVIAENMSLRAEPGLGEVPLPLPHPPPHVIRLLNILLHFDGTIPHKLSIFKKTNSSASYSSVLRSLPEDERIQMTKSLARNQSIQNDAEELCAGVDSETKWAEFYHNNFLSRLPPKNEMARGEKESHQ
jgi:hypothetical protein